MITIVSIIVSFTKLRFYLEVCFSLRNSFKIFELFRYLPIYNSQEHLIYLARKRKLIILCHASRSDLYLLRSTWKLESFIVVCGVASLDHYLAQVCKGISEYHIRQSVANQAILLIQFDMIHIKSLWRVFGSSPSVGNPNLIQVKRQLAHENCHLL